MVGEVEREGHRRSLLRSDLDELLKRGVVLPVREAVRTAGARVERDEVAVVGEGRRLHSEKRDRLPVDHPIVHAPGNRTVHVKTGNCRPAALVDGETVSGQRITGSLRPGLNKLWVYC